MATFRHKCWSIDADVPLLTYSSACMFSTASFSGFFGYFILQSVFLFTANMGEYTFKGTLPFPKQALVLRVCSTSLLKTLREKEKLLVTSNISFSHSFFFFFYLFGELSAILIKLKIVVCQLFQIGRV